MFLLVNESETESVLCIHIFVCVCVFVYVLVIQYKVCICEAKVSHIYNVSLFAILSLSFPLFMFCVFLMVSVTYNFFGVVCRDDAWRCCRESRDILENRA